MRKRLIDNVVAVLAAVLIVGPPAAVLATDSGAIEPGYAKPRVCVPRAVWSADDSERPCARVTRVFEDGSVRVLVFDADGDRRYSFGYGAEDR